VNFLLRWVTRLLLVFSFLLCQILLVMGAVGRRAEGLKGELWGVVLLGGRGISREHVIWGLERKGVSVAWGVSY